MTGSKQTDQECGQNAEGAPEQTRSPARRRLIQGATAAPVLLVSGRSALACNPDTEPCALSPMAWMSIHPQQQSTTVAVSHNVGCNFLGKSPGYWTPNKSGSTFQGLWPVAPFETLTWHVKVNRICTTTTDSASWTPGNWKNYSGLPFDDCSTGKDVGWNTGAKLPAAILAKFGESRSISRILIDESASRNILWHICAAYLNALTWPQEYALTPDEVVQLAVSQQLVPNGRPLSDSEIKAFLDQTWPRWR